MKFWLISTLLLFSLSAMASGPNIVITETKDSVLMQISVKYVSRYKKSDVEALINPDTADIQHLFKDEIAISERLGNQQYTVISSVSAAFIKMNFKCHLSYSSSKSASSSSHQFIFSNFDRLFKSTLIKTDIKELNGETHVSIFQTSSIKPGAYAKIKSVPFGMGVKTFRSKIASNFRQFIIGTGGN